MRVLLVTSDRERCGVREYGQFLQQYLRPYVNVDVEEFPHTHPDSLFAFLDCPRKFDVIHLNHHAALHSAWRPEHVQKLQELGFAVVVTQHDTLETWDLMMERGFPDFRCADGLVVHEEVAGLEHDNAWVMRQGIPSFATSGSPLSVRPTLGVCGFDFPWKGFDDACAAAVAAGWEVHVISPNVTVARAEELNRWGSAASITPGWRSAERVVQTLASCWATAFLYSCGNSGTSGAIRLGVAAHRPVLAYGACRQFRDLRETWPGKWAISWCDDRADVAAELRRLETNYNYNRARRSAVAYLAEVDSWRAQAHYYRELYKRADRRREDR